MCGPATKIQRKLNGGITVNQFSSIQISIELRKFYQLFFNNFFHSLQMIQCREQVKGNHRGAVDN